jgi:flagellar basal body rod protein FlgB
MKISPHQSLDTSLDLLRAISQRQSLSSANIANAHTPGYTARSASFSELLKSDNPFETDLSRKMGSQISALSTDTGLPVDLQKELIEMQKNYLYFSMVSRRASSIINNIKAASQVGR